MSKYKYMTDMELALIMAGSISMAQSHFDSNPKYSISKSHLRYVEETSDSIANPYARKLIRQVIQQMRKDMNPGSSPVPVCKSVALQNPF